MIARVTDAEHRDLPLYQLKGEFIRWRQELGASVDEPITEEPTEVEITQEEAVARLGTHKEADAFAESLGFEFPAGVKKLSDKIEALVEHLTRSSDLADPDKPAEASEGDGDQEPEKATGDGDGQEQEGEPDGPAGPEQGEPTDSAPADEGSTE